MLRAYAKRLLKDTESVPDGVIEEACRAGTPGFIECAVDEKYDPVICRVMANKLEADWHHMNEVCY